MKGCSICDSGAVGRTWSRDVILGKKSSREMAEYFGVDHSEVMEHLNTHELVVDDSKGIYESPDFYMNELLKLLKMLKDWLKITVEEGKTDKFTIDNGIKLSKEVRLTLESLAQFQGRFDRTSNVQLTQVNMKYMQLTTVLLSEVCDECRGKIIKVLDEATPVAEIAER